MHITTHSLTGLSVGFKASFAAGLGMHESQWPKVAMNVPSSTGTEEYAWLGDVPGMREWVGDRVVKNLSEHGFSITNKDFEQTIGVRRNAIEDDQYGVYSPLFTEMGRAASAHKDELVFPLMNAAFSTVCYDGQFLIDTDHPVTQTDGSTASVSNFGGGSGTPWFLIDMSRAVKPFILQNRKENEFIAKDNPNDESVFWNKEFIYGTDGRRNVGVGLWQLIFGSKDTLNEANYKAARQAMMAFKGDHGRPLGIMPNLLVVPPGLEGQAKDIVEQERQANGESNNYQNTAELLTSPWLS